MHAHAHMRQHTCAKTPPMDVFPEPKLRRKKRAVPRAASFETEGASSKCRGVLVGDSVLVQDKCDINSLVKNGCYGKSAFSRSIPPHPARTRTTRRRTPSEECAGGSSEPPNKRSRFASDNQSEDKELKKKRTRLALHTVWEEFEEGFSTSCQQDTLCVTEDERSNNAREGLSRPPLTKDKIIDSGKGAIKEETLTSENPHKDDPYPLMGPLCLASEEAFYLANEVKLLNVYPSTDDTQYYTADELWKKLCSACPRFPFTYSVYRHYRRKGWVPKSGLKFGVDFILYKDDPESYHSSYAILVHEILPETVHSFLNATGEAIDIPKSAETTINPTSFVPAAGEHWRVGEGYVAAASETAGVPELVERPSESLASAPSDGPHTREHQRVGEEVCEPRLRWIDVIAHCRVCESTAKELVVCHVTISRGFDKTHLLSSPNCLEHMSLCEVLVTRWLPEKDT